MLHKFTDRRHAGHALARELKLYAGLQDVVVLALPRGGVPVGYEVAKALGAPLDVLVVRKLGTPGHEELAMGAIASGGVLVREEGVIRFEHIDDATLRKAVEHEQIELARRERLYRGGLGPVPIEGRTVLLVDDGLATGATMRAAVRSVRAQQPRQVVVAAPVAQPEVVALLETEADRVVTVILPPRLVAVGMWYEDFEQTDDAEVQALLQSAAQHLTS